MEKAVILSPKELRKPDAQFINRFDLVYAGDEFCQLKLPAVKELTALRGLFRGKIVLAFPILTDRGLAEFKKLVKLAESWGEDGEVIINDIGALSYLAGRETKGIKVSLGRVLAANLSSFTASGRFADLFGGVLSSLEIDDRTALNNGLNSGILKLHLYYPFKFIAFSRCCYQSGKINTACSYECLEKPRFLEIYPDPLREKLFLDGNAVFGDNSAIFREMGGLRALAANPRVTRIVFEPHFFRAKRARGGRCRQTRKPENISPVTANSSGLPRKHELTHENTKKTN